MSKNYIIFICTINNGIIYDTKIFDLIATRYIIFFFSIFFFFNLRIYYNIRYILLYFIRNNIIIILNFVHGTCAFIINVSSERRPFQLSSNIILYSRWSSVNNEPQRVFFELCEKISADIFRVKNRIVLCPVCPIMNDLNRTLLLCRNI